ncbi:hypothetical protein JRQ81_007790 [Phrynocephalus forsythii]|uniref:Uncharacterized protein n=1 Tax=Phrynocephalus forsythii TaxID=171643 RepID=A0A9Q1ATD4_9SAUR|nr:hypothetical protein JRQ81_007790 [Phrynocephalus forsythii]
MIWMGSNHRSAQINEKLHRQVPPSKDVIIYCHQVDNLHIFLVFPLPFKKHIKPDAVTQAGARSLACKDTLQHKNPAVFSSPKIAWDEGAEDRTMSKKTGSAIDALGSAPRADPS